MPASPTTSPTTTVPEHAPTERERTQIFWEWCLGREAFSLAPSLMLVLPLIFMVFDFYFGRLYQWSPNQGRTILRMLFAVAAMTVVGGGALHAAHAVCWEVSAELRELVRLTGMGPITLLLLKSLARWLSIACSLLVLLPLVCFALTLGGATITQVTACGWGLLMLAVLTASFAALASVLSNSSQNVATTAAMSTFILILLYHMLFWVSNLLIALALSTTGGWQPPDNSWARSAYDFQWQAVPVTVMYRISQTPSLFSPLDPAYWVHFITAACVFRMAITTMVHRFAAESTPGNVGVDDAAARSDAAFRPRCGDDSFFWKDAYVLSGLAIQRSWSVVYLVLAIVVLSSGLMRWEGNVTLAVGIIAECVWPVVFAMRFDSLLSAEFRQQTWGSLMLLPIDRSVLLNAKLRAVLWEHRLIWLPVCLAMAFAFPFHPQAVLVTGVLTSLAAVLLIQVSALYYVTPHSWWTGVARLLEVIVVITFCVALWLAFPVWASFSMTVMVLLVTILTAQSYIQTRLDDWHESPEYRSTTKRKG